MNARKLLYVVLVLLPLTVGSLSLDLQTMSAIPDGNGSTLVDVGNDQFIEVGPDEVLRTYSLSDIPTEVQGTGDALVGQEHGVRTDSFTDQSMYYNSSSSSIDAANLSVSLGEDWEGYEVFGNVTSITENRTWINNSGFDSSANWTYLTHDEPSSWGSFTNPLTSQWLANGHGSGDGCAFFEETGYYYDDRPTTSMYGWWYDPGDKAYAVQNLTIDRGDITWVGISLDYWANCGGWSSYMTGFFELFVSVGDPDQGGSYLWNIQFDAIDDDEIWYSTGFVEVDPSIFTLPNISIWAGLRVATLEWYRPDINPEGMLDNIMIYVKAKATPEEVNLQMNGVNVNNVMDGLDPIRGLGTVAYTPTTPWAAGAGYANFSWTPTPNPPDPNFDINVDINVEVSLYARRYDVDTISDTETYSTGDSYVAANYTDIRWETNFYVAVPGGYSSWYFFNVTLPGNRNMDYVAEPNYRYVNLTSGWSLGDPGDQAVNVSVYSITQTSQNGFWLLKGSSPNMISNLEVWDGAQWTSSNTFRADDDTRFRATVSPTYLNDIVNFTIYDSSGSTWENLQATVDASGYAVTSYVNLGATNASVGTWEVQATVNDTVSAGSLHNVGFYARQFSIDHSTQMAVKYPVGSETSWTKNVTHGDLMLLQLRVNDSDNGDLLAGGTMTYSWAAGAGSMSDLGTGEYSVTLDTGDLPSNNQFDVDLVWTKGNFDPLYRAFTINAIYPTELLSSDAPGVDVPSGYDAYLDLYYEDHLSQPITDAAIQCNWTLDEYHVTPVGGQPGHYTLAIETDSGVALDNYAVEITANKDYYESRTIILSVQVRDLHTSAIPSTSFLSLPVGYTTSFTITYTDTDHDSPITGAESAIRCNWSDIHVSGDQNYTVIETATPGVYEVTLYSKDLDVLDTYDVVFDVEMGGAQNHTFIVTVELRTHLTSFYLINPIDPTSYTADITVYVMYYDVDQDTGIENGTAVGYHVMMDVTSLGLPVIFSVQNGTTPGEYVIMIPANQWGSIGPKDLMLYVNWTGPTVKYSNETISTSVTVTGTPTDLYLGESPVMTPYGENISFTLIYYDVGNDTGIVNATGPYPGNVHLFIQIVTLGETLQQSDMVITEIDYLLRPGEYRIEFNTTLLSGLTDVDLRIWFNWTKGTLPLYENRTLLVTVRATYRQTTIDWNPMPITPFDELVNLSLVYRDVLSGEPILNSLQLTISIQEAITYTLFYDGDATGVFQLEIDTSSWNPGSYVFHIDVIWSGTPYYQNRTSVEIPITVRERFTDLTHGSYAPVQYGNTLTLNFTYRDLDDYTSANMDGGTLTLDDYSGTYYDVTDNGDGTYTLVLRTEAFPATGMYMVNVSIVYGGSRHCQDATDFFYLTITERRTQLVSDLPNLAPYLELANVTVHYTDDNDNSGIVGAQVYAFCATAAQPLVLNSNYWVTDLGGGAYLVMIDTVALGTFGPYSIIVTVNWTGTPFYMERVISIDIEVSRRPVTLTVSKSPLNTPFRENVTFEITATDVINGSLIDLDKSVLMLTHGGGTGIFGSQYSLSQLGGIYTVSLNSTVLSTGLLDEHLITVKLFWGDMIPYYSNSTASTEVTVTNRYTQGFVLLTPPAFIYFNLSATLKYNDYLTGDGIPGAALAVSCENNTMVTIWTVDNGDGTYEILVNTTELGGLGRFFFTANFTWVGTPYYQNVTGVAFSVVVNPVSTTLKFVIQPGTTYYLGDLVIGNITFTDIDTGQGVEGATVMTDWGDLYGTAYTLVDLGNGVHRLSVDTTGLDAALYIFHINATKYLHLNRTVTADILLAAIPVDIQVVFSPTDPEYGEEIQIQANVTDARTGAPVLGSSVNLIFLEDVYVMTDLGGGLYNYTISTLIYVAGEYTLRITSSLLNYETAQRDFQVRVDKIASSITASLDPQLTVNGATVTIEAQYVIKSNGTSIPDGTVTFSWVGGNGTLTWQPGESKYVGQFVIVAVLEGTHQILIQGASDNFKTVSTERTLEITDIATELLAHDAITVVSVVSGDFANITIFLNNTDLNLPVTGASLSYSVDVLLGDFIELGGGYYTANVPTETLDIRDWVLTVSSALDGYTPSSMQLTLSIQRIPTEIVLLGEGQIEEYYGLNATFQLRFWDSHHNIGISNATATYLIETFAGTLIDLGDGRYNLTLNTTLVSAGSVPHDISVAFQKLRYAYAYGSLKLLVKPIETQLEGNTEQEFPVDDNYGFAVFYNDIMHNELILDANATAIWEFGSVDLVVQGDGSYLFGREQTGIMRLEVRTEPYLVTIYLSKGNYSRGELVVALTIREIYTELRWQISHLTIHAGEIFYVTATYWDLDHNTAIPNAVNSTPGLLMTRFSDQEEDFGNGTYLFAFQTPGIGRYDLKIVLDLDDYVAAELNLVIYSELSPEQEMMRNYFIGGALLLLMVAGLAALYIKVLSVPKMLRWLRAMISTLRKGGIPSPAPVRDRRNVLLDIMNDELLPVNIMKTETDISPSTVDVTVLDVEELLFELAEVVGLEESDVATLRRDLDAMRPSERAGFLSEVIKQERARRARAIAEAEVAAEPSAPVAELSRKLTEEELDYLRERLKAMGIEDTETDLMVEQARNLTKAEVDALLDQIGGEEK